MECVVMGQEFHRGFTAAEKTGVMGSLEARREGDWTSFWQAVVVDLFFGGAAWWDSCCPAAALQAGIDARGTRGDFQRRYGPSIGAIDRQVAWPLTLDGEPGNERNGGYDRYRAALADENAWARARRPKCCKLANSPRLRQAGNRAWYERSTGHTVGDVQKKVSHPIHKWMTATLDGLVQQTGGVFEAKVHAALEFL
jgi:hypothetical protein